MRFIFALFKTCLNVKMLIQCYNIETCKMFYHRKVRTCQVVKEEHKRANTKLRHSTVFFCLIRVILLFDGKVNKAKQLMPLYCNNRYFKL